MRISSSSYVLVGFAALLVVATACEKESSDLPPPPNNDYRGRTLDELEQQARPMIPDDPEEPGQSEQTESSREGQTLMNTGGNSVTLSLNGARVRVVRPSLNNPFVVATSEFEEAGERVPRGPSGGSGPSVGLVRDEVIDVIRRVPQSVEVVVADPNGVGDILEYRIEFEGYPGQFVVPTEIDSEIFGAAEREQGRVTLGFFLDEVFPPGGQPGMDWTARLREPFDVNMRIWAIDRDQNNSRVVAQRLSILPVGLGDLEVTLSMALPSDLDLYVVEPNGNVIYWGNMQSYTQGRLDLDANAACNSNSNVRYEHIFWPEGEVPAGSYEVRVDNWRNCVGGREVDFEVIVQNCGDISVYESVAQGYGGGSDCQDGRTASCEQIAIVEVIECEQTLAP